MNTKIKGFSEIRYLLHGRKDDDGSDLFITSDSNNLWQTIAQQLLQENNQSWRLIAQSCLSKEILSYKDQLKIKEITPKDVVELIRKKPSSVNASQLEEDERNVLLSYLVSSEDYKTLWRKLPLHKDINGNFVSINETTYLENENFTLCNNLTDLTLIKLSNKGQRKDWIDQWTPKKALEFILSKYPTPHEDYAIILQCLDELRKTSEQIDHIITSQLREKPWLTDQETSKGINPCDVVLLPQDISLEDTKRVINICSNQKYGKFSLHQDICDSVIFDYLRELNLFDEWDYQKVLTTVLEPNNCYDYWDIILDTARHLDTDTFNSCFKKDLQDKAWLLLENRQAIKPQNIIQVNKKLTTYLDGFLGIGKEKYAQDSELIKDIQDHISWLKEKRLFSYWNENKIISFIIKNTTEYHLYSDIIIDCLEHLNLQGKPIDNYRIKEVPWLTTKEGKYCSPQQVLDIPKDVEDDIEKILTLSQSEYVTFSMLSDDISNKRKYFKDHKLLKTGESVWEIIGKELSKLEQYYLGEFPIEQFSIEKWLEVLTDIDFEILPIWHLLKTIESKTDIITKLLPYVIGKIEKNRLIKILNWINSNHKKAKEDVRKLYNEYLKLAYKYPEFKTEILRKIKFLNRDNSWQTPNQLCWDWGNEEQDIGINFQYVLNNQQRDILKNYLKGLEESGVNTQASGNEKFQEDNQSNAQFLQEYFREWKKYLPSSVLIGAFLSLITGKEKPINELARSYLLKEDFNQTRQSFIKSRPPKNFTIIADNNSEDSIRQVSLTGEPFDAPKSENTLGSIFRGNLNPNISELRFRTIDIKQFSSDQLSEVLLRSVRDLIEKVYLCEIENLDDIWERLSKSEQLNIEVARYFILNSTPYVLQMLGVQNKNPIIQKLIKKWNDENHQRSNWKRQNRKEDIDTTDKRIDSILQELSDLLKDPNIQKDILSAVRNKIKQHGYSPESIPFELFQNADDALVELEKLSGESQLDQARLQFILLSSENELNILHWGRPINYFIDPNSRLDYSRYGFDRDLEKMLSFYISDKSFTPTPSVTGKFGLGFKSVHLICQYPTVLSGQISFKILGGLLPYELEDKQKKEHLENLLKKYNQDIEDGTIINLPIDKFQVDSNIFNNCVIPYFTKMVGFLLICAKRIKRCWINNHEFYCIEQTISGIQGIKIITINENLQINKTRTLCIDADNKLSILMCFSESRGGLYSCLSSEIPNIWVTAPTQETLGIDFIINSQFEVTTGREKLGHYDSNRDFLQTYRIGEKIGEKLCELFDLGKDNWQQLKDVFNFTAIEEYDFWYFIWKTLAESWLDKFDKEDSTLKLVRLILGGNCGMGYFITHCPSLPNDLWGDYQKLISPEKTCYIVTGILATQNCFEKVSTWTEFTERCLDNIVNASVWNNVKLLLGDYFNFQQTEELKLIDVLKWQLGEQFRAIPTVAKSLGQLITRKFFAELYQESSDISEVLKTIKFQAEDGKFYASYKLLSKYYLRPNLSSNNYYEILGIPYNSEIHDIKKAYRSLARKYHPDVNKEANADEQFKKINSAYETLSDTEKRHIYDRQHQLISKIAKTEEQLLANFAPQSRLINNDYVDIDIALDFFFICRDKLDDISVQELAQWVWEANTESQRQAVITYLERGKKASTLAEYLQKVNRNSWLKEDSKIQKILDDIVEVEEIKEFNFREYRKTQNYNNHFSQFQTSTTNTPNSYSSINTPVSSKPIITLKHIYEWWKNIDRDQYIKEYYEDSIYPIKTSDFSKKLKLEKINRKCWMILFFLGLTHRIGRTKYEQHRDFINFCWENKNWWSSFSSPQPKQKSEQWMKVLDEYFDNPNSVQEIKWLYWMEKFPVIYQISCYLDEYIQVFTDVDKINHVFNLGQITAVRGSYIFNGTGIDAPPLMLGMGANFIVRELVRLEVIKLTPYIREHCLGASQFGE